MLVDLERSPTMARMQAGHKVEGVVERRGEVEREVLHRMILEACLVEVHEERLGEEASLANTLVDPRGTYLVDLERRLVGY